MIEKFWKMQDNKVAFAALFANLFLILIVLHMSYSFAKLNAHGLYIESLSFILAYFNNQKEKER